MRYRELVEKYTADNTYLLKYLRDGKFDPYTYWNEIRVYFDNHEDELEELSAVAGKEFTDADAIDEEDPELYFKLPDWLQTEIAEWVVEWLIQHDPAEAPTYAHVGLNKKQLLPRNTWLVHFTDDPDGIAEKGFTIGMDDITKLGLTTYYKKTSSDKSYGGYNFAFLADSRHAKWAASERKYGEHAVLFQNSGVLTHHYGDEEDQVIFHGEDVDPRDIVILRRDDDWQVEARRDTRRHSSLYAGDFEKCVAWVQQHFAQYRRYLTMR